MTLLSSCAKPRPKIDGELLGPSYAWGHRLRTGDFPAPIKGRKLDVAIIGGGVAGLSAAWQLKHAGLGDFTLFELEPEVGGNARCGHSSVSGFPWGAHYLPLPTREAGPLIDLLKDLSVITSFAKDGSPIYDERYLLTPPDERLYQLGLWRSGLRPQGSKRAEAEFTRFDSLIADLRTTKTADGLPAFTTPTQRSSADPKLQALDRISVKQWLDDHQFSEPLLKWFVEYGCRDDFGATLATTSAWAGIHYHAGRTIWGNYADGQLLTWPEGNGWLVARMRGLVAEHIATSRMAIRVIPGEHCVDIDIWDGTAVERITAQQVILCTPSFVTERLLPDARRCGRVYNPWVVANLHVSRLPDNVGAELAWDNVMYDSPSLGYVCATHQQLKQTNVGPSVLTYYLPFPDGGAKAREQIFKMDWHGWTSVVLDDLRRAHPDIDDIVTRIDVWPWGHGMVAPSPGLIFSAAMSRVRSSNGRVHFAHSDLSCISLFEEAHYWGVRAAEKAVRSL